MRMKSLNNYSKEKFSFINSINSSINEKPIYTFESLIVNHGADIDSVFHKMNLHNRRIANPYINESEEDVLFSIEEQFAIRNMFLTICEEYEKSLCIEFCNENNIDIDFTLINESAKDFLNKIGQAVNQGSEKVVNGFKSLGEKIQAVKKFVNDILSKAIKTAKELVNKFLEMMITLGIAFGELINKLSGGDDEKYQEEFQNMIYETLKDESKAKENIYESLAFEINEGIFDRFKKKKEETNNTQDKENVYDQAAKAKTNKSKGNIVSLKDAGIKIILQIAAYVAITIILPAIVTLIAGPLAGAIAEVICKVFWSSRVIYKQVSDMIKKCKSAEFKKQPAWMKAIHWALFFIMMFFSIKTLGNSISDGWEITKKIVEGAADAVLPSGVVQSVTAILNDFYKFVTDENTSGYEAMIAAKDKTLERIIETVSKEKEASDRGKENFDNHNNNGEFKPSETNNFQHTEDIAGSELKDKMKAIADADDLNTSTKVLNAADQVQISTPGVTAVGIDGATLGKIGRTEYIKQIAELIGVEPSDIDISQVTNTALQQSSDGAAGTFFQVVIKGDATQEMANKVADAVSTVASDAGTTGWFHMFSKVTDFEDTVKTIIKEPVQVFTNSWSFGGLGPIALKYIKKYGPFNMRLGSARTGYHVYKIDKDCIDEIPYNEFISNYKEKNPKAIAQMERIINDNFKLLEAAEKQLSDNNNLTRKERKKLNYIRERIEAIKNGKAEDKVLVFFTHDKFASEPAQPKKKRTNEAFEHIYKRVINEAEENKEVNNSSEKYPVLFFNPIILAGGDLTRQTKTKGPRASLYYAKGIFYRLEFLPIDGGMSLEQIINMFGDMINESIKSSIKMTADMPCTNDSIGERSGHWELNTNSASKDEERSDFGGFTNKEITDILNNPKDVTKYLGWQYATDKLLKNKGKLKYSEQTKSEKLKKHHDEVIKQYKDIMDNDKEVKEFIQSHKSLKNILLDKEGKIVDKELDKISNNLIRIENNYLGGAKKQSLFRKFRNWLLGEYEEEKPNPKDLEQLAYLLASKRIKLKKQRVSEGLDEFYDLIFLEANIDILQREYENWCNGDLLLD